ncbi:MAG: MgtC/SapB family protein [Rubellimicrobium sp.]|nr:MgtC/SapB family protein [Rubellimicrobium sp.]
MTLALATATINLSIALGCGALIGLERQVRQRKAGLRTNALVALGSAAYMVFSMLIEGDMSPSRVAAQVVSGIGFLGAGIIFRDGFNIHGLTTAATLWCSAAVGLLAGAGHWDFALMTTGLVVFVNLGLRPFVQWLKRRLNAEDEHGRHYRVALVVTEAQEAAARALMLRTLALGGLRMTEIVMTRTPEGIELAANITGEGIDDAHVEQAVQHLLTEPGLARVHWSAVED